MTAAAPFPGLTKPTTDAVRLLAALRWLVFLLLVHWLIAGGRKLAAALRQGTAHPDFPVFAKRFGTDDTAVILARVTRGLGRATALEAELLATGPADRRLTDIAHRRVIGARIIDIARDLGVFRAAPARIVRRGHMAPRHLNRFPLTLTPPTAAPATCVQPAATGPPDPQPHHMVADTDAGMPWNFSRRAPASFLLYALS